MGDQTLTKTAFRLLYFGHYYEAEVQLVYGRAPVTVDVVYHISQDKFVSGRVRMVRCYAGADGLSRWEQVFSKTDKVALDPAFLRSIGLQLDAVIGRMLSSVDQHV